MLKTQNHDLIVIVQDSDDNVLERIELDSYQLDTQEGRMQLIDDFIEAVETALSSKDD